MYAEPELMTVALQTLVKKGPPAFRRQTFFANNRYTPDFRYHLDHLGVLSSGEQVYILVLLDLWNGQGDAKFNELYKIDYGMRELIFSLYQALSRCDAYVRAWVARQSK